MVNGMDNAVINRINGMDNGYNLYVELLQARTAQTRIFSATGILVYCRFGGQTETVLCGN
jgi:hypothetical protein